MSPTEIARETANKYLENQTIFSLENIPDEMQKKNAVFVSIKINNNLRGCIGTIEPTKNCVAQEIISNTIAALNDPRFLKVKKEETPNLKFEVYILSEMIPVDKEAINPKKEGILVSFKDRKGILLPGIVDNYQEQLNIALKKAGINPKENYQTFKFTAEKYVEK